jgi:hypothetical protein
MFLLRGKFYATQASSESNLSGVAGMQEGPHLPAGPQSLAFELFRSPQGLGLISSWRQASWALLRAWLASSWWRLPKEPA